MPLRAAQKRGRVDRRRCVRRYGLRSAWKASLKMAAKDCWKVLWFMKGLGNCAKLVVVVVVADVDVVDDDDDDDDDVVVVVVVVVVVLVLVLVLVLPFSQSGSKSIFLL